MELLIQNKAEIEIGDIYSHTPLYFADLWKRIEAKQYLIDSGAKLLVIPKKK